MDKAQAPNRIRATDPTRQAFSLPMVGGRPDPAEVDGRRGEAMRPDDHSRDMEAGFFPVEVGAANPLGVSR